MSVKSKAAKFGLGNTLLIGGAIVVGAIAIKALTGGAKEGGDIGSMSLGGQDDPYSDEGGMFAPGYAAEDPVVNDPYQAALVDAVTDEEFGSGSSSEALFDPNDNPFPQAGGQNDTVGDISRFTSQPTPAESNQADFLSNHPVVGYSLLGVSLVPSWFSSKFTKTGENLAGAVKPSLKTAEKGVSDIPFNKRALSYLDKQILKSGEIQIGEGAAKAGVKAFAKKGVMTGAKLGVKSIPFIGLGAGVAIDKATGIPLGRAVVRNVVGDIAGGFAGGFGTVAGPAGTIGGAVGGQVGGELATDWVWGRGKIIKDAFFTKPKLLSDEEKKGIKSNFTFNDQLGMFMSPSDSMIMSKTFRPSSQAASANKVSVASQQLAAANASRGSSGTYSSDAIAAMSGIKSNRTYTATSVLAGKPTATDLRIAASSKAIKPAAPAPSPSKSSVSTSSAVSSSRYTGSSSSVKAALSGPKKSAKGKYTASKK